MQSQFHPFNIHTFSFRRHLFWPSIMAAVVGFGSLPMGVALAAQWDIPIAGNAFQTRGTQEESASNLVWTREQRIVWSGSEIVCSVYFHIDRPATLELAIRAGCPEGRSTLVATVQGHRFQIPVDDSEFAQRPVGQLEVSEAGYVRVDIRGVTKTGNVFAEIGDLIVTSDTSELSIDYVRTNDGNMFYWGRRGPSVHLRYEVPRETMLRYAYNEIVVPEGKDPVGTFYMANGFGEGYFGMQVNGPDERRVLFSVWSPFQTDNPREIPPDQRVILIAKGDGVQVGQFGNEGSGGQSYWVYPWKSKTTYRFLTEVRPDGQGNTIYSSWFGDQAEDTWKLIASFQRPKTDTHLRGFHGFLECFSPAFGHLERRAAYGNVWVGDTSGRWHECTRAVFSVDATGRGRHRLDYAGGSIKDQFYLLNCGFGRHDVRPGATFTRQSTVQGPPSIDLESLPR